MSSEITGRRRQGKVKFVQIQNSMFEDDRIGWKAKGLLGYLLSRPDGWKVNVSDLIKRSTDGEKSVRAGIKEIREFGYLAFHKIKNDKGQFVATVWEYDDVPFVEEIQEPKTHVPKNGMWKNGNVENGHSEKGVHISNTDFSNTDLNNTENIKHNYIDTDFNPLEAMKKSLGM